MPSTTRCARSARRRSRKCRSRRAWCCRRWGRCEESYPSPEGGGWRRPRKRAAPGGGTHLHLEFVGRLSRTRTPLVCSVPDPAGPARAAPPPLRYGGHPPPLRGGGIRSERTREERNAMAKGNKVIITCAVTGSIHTPTMSPHLPITSQEIADAAIGASEAGAAIVHLHARDPKDGRPDQSPDAFAPFLKVIKQRANVVVNITTGGAPTMAIEERVKPAATFKPEVASLNMGSMNFGLYPMLARYKQFKYDWEKPYLEGSHDRIFKNTFTDIEYILTTCPETAPRFEIECYDIAPLYTPALSAARGVVKPPFFIQSVFGILGGIGPHPEDVMHMRRTADRLFGRDKYQWSVLGAGRNQMAIAAMSVAMGGNVRVGLEDSLWIGPGKLAESNAAQVTQARQIIEGLGYQIASADEAREILELKGGDKVAF